MKQTVREVETEIEMSIQQKLEHIPQFAGYRPRAVIYDKKTGKNKRSDSAMKWPADSLEIRIAFEPGAEVRPANTRAPRSPRAAAAETPKVAPAIVDLIRSLHAAESKPGYDFVALKWFRDSVLPAVNSAWSEVNVRDSLLRDAIDRRIVLTSKVPNPKSPMYPVTAIRLNRSHADVQAILGVAADTTLDFQPVSIRGEDLSATVLRERR